MFIAVYKARKPVLLPAGSRVARGWGWEGDGRQPGGRWHRHAMAGGGGGAGS